MSKSIPATKELNRIKASEKYELKTPQAAKISAMANLLANIGEVNFETVCTKLGWVKSVNCKKPSQKHIKVAIVHVLIETSKIKNCHIVHKSRFFYIYNGEYYSGPRNPDNRLRYVLSKKRGRL